MQRGAQEQAGRYATWTQERGALQEGIERDKRTQEALGTRQQDLEHLVRLWPGWVDRLQAQEELEGLEEPPPGGAVRLPELRGLLERQGNLEGERAGLRGELGALPAPSAALLTAQPELEALTSDLAAHRERQRGLAQREMEIGSSGEDLTRQRTALPVPWTQEALADFHAAEYVPHVDALERRLTHAAERHAAVQAQVGEAQREAEQAREQLGLLPPLGSLEEPATTEEEHLLRGTVVDAQSRLDAAVQAADTLNPDAALLSALPTLRATLEHAPLHLLQDLPRLQQEVQRQEELLPRMLAELGGPWTADRLSAHRREDEQAWRQGAQTWARKLAEAQRAEEEAGRTLTAREQALRESEVRLQGHAKLPETAELDRQLGELQAQHHLAGSVRTRLQVQPGAPGTSRPAATWPLWVSVALTAVLTLCAFLVHPLLALLTLTCGLALAYLQRPVTASGAPSAPPERAAVLLQDLKTLGLTGQAGLGEVLALEGELNGKLASLTRIREAAGQRDDAQRRHRGDQTLVQEASKAVQDTRESRAEAERSFATWAVGLGFGLGRPEELDAVLLRVTAARDALLKIQGLREDLRKTAGDVTAFRERSAELLMALGRATTADAALTDLRQALKDAEEAERLAERLALARHAVTERQEDVDREAVRLQSLREKLAQQRMQAQQRAQSAEQLLTQKQETLKDAAQDLDGAQAEWTSWLRAQELPPLSPAQMRVLLERLQRAADTARQVLDKGAQLVQLQVAVRAFEERMAEVVTRATGAPSVQGAQDLLATLEAARQASEISERRQDLTVRLAGLDRQCGEVQRAVTTILEECGAPDLHTLEHWEVLRERRAILRTRVLEAERDLHLLGGQRASELRAELDLAQPGEWHSELERISGQRQALAERQDERYRRDAELALELRQLADSPTSANVGQFLENQREQLRQDARAWLVRRLAGELLSTTLREYERTKGPEVLRHASEVFSHITGGRYVAVRQVEGSAAFRAVTERDELVDIDQLSRGTQEQLYLSVRLGLARTLGQRTAKVPLLMDDILVNADPERAASVAAALAEVAREHQVLYLTCHPSSADQLRTAAPDAQLLTLPRLMGTMPPLRPAARGRQPLPPFSNSWRKRANRAP